MYIFHVSAIGGGSLCLFNMVKELDRKKFNPIILLKTIGPLCEKLEKIGATVIIEPSLETVPYNQPLHKFTSIRQIISVIFSLRKVEYWIKHTNAEIIHINTMMMYPYSIPSFKLKRKVIVHIREHWLVDKNKFQLNFAKKIINQCCNAIIAINKTSADIINIPSKTQIIYDWINFSNRDNVIDFKTIFGNDFKNLKIFLFLGGIQKIKGALQVVKVFDEVMKQEDARLLFVGPHTKHIVYDGFKGLVKKTLNIFNYFTYSDKIKRIAQKNDRIVFMKATPHVKSLFEQSYCTVSYPSFPHAIIPIAESIYLGKPVISAKTPESIEYSNHGKGARLFKMNDKKSFMKEFKYAYHNKENIYKSAQENRDYIKELFSLKRNKSLLNKLYYNLIEQ